jgi:hypothetical protein
VYRHVLVWGAPFRDAHNAAGPRVSEGGCFIDPGFVRSNGSKRSTRVTVIDSRLAHSYRSVYFECVDEAWGSTTTGHFVTLKCRHMPLHASHIAVEDPILQLEWCGYAASRLSVLQVLYTHRCQQ